MLNKSISTKVINSYAQLKEWLSDVFIPKEDNDYLSLALRPKKLIFYAYALLLIKIAVISIFLVLPYADFFSAITEQRLVSLINQARIENNLSPVTLNNTLNETAGFKINDMLTNNYFEHTSPAGVTPWFWFKKAGYNYEYAGENLAIDFFQTDDVFSAWMQSPAHRDNILNPNFKEIGLAVKSGPLKNHEATLAVLVFGAEAKTKTPKNNLPALVKSQSPSPSATPKTQPTVKPSATPTILKNTPSALPTSTILSSASANPVSTSPAPEVLAQQENIELKSPTEIETEALAAKQTTKGTASNNLSTENEWTPKVLGAFVSKTDEVTKSLYLYFTLFLILALVVNIFVKIEVQYWQTTLSATLVILLSCVLIFI